MDLQEIPRNELLSTAFLAYQTSAATKKLKSEQFRTLFADEFETKQTSPLSGMCLKKIAQQYKGRPISLNLSPIQSNTFYDNINPNLPIRQCINIDDEYYWKRVYCLICNDKIAIRDKMIDESTCWKELVITMKFVDVIEKTPVEIWLLDEMHQLSKLVSPFIKEVIITKLQPLRESSFRKQQEGIVETEAEELEAIEEEEKTPSEDESFEEEDTRNTDLYPVELCHHVNLSIVKNLTIMHTLAIEFLPPELEMHYHTRLYNFSYTDMQNLASGISELPNLKTFIIRRSRLDCVKLSTILEAIKAIFIERLEFVYCQLDDDSGESLYEFLLTTSTLKNLNLSGNHFCDPGIEYLAVGIAKSPSSLTHLTLSNNPIADKAICKLCGTLTHCTKLTHLGLAGVRVNKPGSISMAKLIETNLALECVDYTTTPMESYYLINAVDKNRNIQQLLCQGCGLSIEEEFKVELLLKRNRYIRENPYIGDLTKTEEEINTFVGRIKNPILLKALGSKQDRIDCQKRIKERNVINQMDDQKESEEFHYEADKFTRTELSSRITLFAQTNFNFFKN